MKKCFIGMVLSLSALIVPAWAQVQFKDITKQAGISFVHNNGATGKKWLPETMGPGCRLHRLRQRRVSRHPIGEWQGLDGWEDKFQR